MASSPATAAKEVVTVNSATEAGVYTVTWSTKGGCDPGAGTSGASGSATLTVVDADGAGSGTTGTAVETGVVIEKDCTYEWTASLVKADGSRCKANWGDSPPADDAESRTIGVGACNTVEKVTFAVRGYTTPCVSNPDPAVPGSVADGDCLDDHDTTVIEPSDEDKGAVKETTFTVTATERVPEGAQPDEECATVSGETKVNDDGVNQVELTLTDATLNGGDCSFIVTAALPPGFDVGTKGSNSRRVDMDGDPFSAGNQAHRIWGVDKQGTVDSADDDNTALEVTIATRTVYLVQNVIGDAGGANATYKYDAPCGAPGLPGALDARPDKGGIRTTAGSVTVELREGRFNVSEAIGDKKADGTKAAALTKKAEACSATVSISGIPDHCSAETGQSADLTTSDPTTIIEFTIDCTPAPEPEPPADAGGDMTDDGAGDGGNGGDMMDDAGDDMTGGGDAGPPPDAPTG